MYVVALLLVTAMAVLGLFHWGIHTYGYGLTGASSLAILLLVALLLSGRWG